MTSVIFSPFLPFYSFLFVSLIDSAKTTVLAEICMSNDVSMQGGAFGGHSNSSILLGSYSPYRYPLCGLKRGIFSLNVEVNNFKTVQLQIIISVLGVKMQQ